MNQILILSDLSIYQLLIHQKTLKQFVRVLLLGYKYIVILTRGLNLYALTQELKTTNHTDFLNNIIFSDEALLHLDGFARKSKSLFANSRLEALLDHSNLKRSCSINNHR